jgi:membrane protease YdiL (CAAX protease family)
MPFAAQWTAHILRLFFSLLMTYVLFGLAHFSGGLEYAFVAGLAGIGYGVAYWTTGRLEASIITHFLLNLIHLVFFTYPMLAA